MLGVGLQRVWNSALDACFYADNIYNNKTFNGKPPSLEDPIEGPIEWSAHLDNITNLMTTLGNNSRNSKLSAEMNSGVLDKGGPVVNQITRYLKSRNIEAPEPQYLPVAEPWYRYHEYEIAIRKNQKGSNLFENIHPTTTRELAIFEKNAKFVDKGVYLRNKATRPTAAMLTWSKRFECSAFWCDMSMKLLQIDGQAAPGEKALEKKATYTATEENDDKDEPAKEERPKMNSGEIQAIAKRKSDSLRNNIVVVAMSPRPSDISKKDRSGIDAIIFQAAEKDKHPNNEYSTKLFADVDLSSVNSSQSKRSSVVPQPVATTAAISPLSQLLVLAKRTSRRSRNSRKN